MASEVEIPDATAITPWLFVGAQESVALERRPVLVEMGVTHVVSMQRVPQPWLVGKAGAELGPLPFQYLHVKIEDTLSAKIEMHFGAVHAFLTDAKTTGGRALVHCAFGISRSVTVACAHLMIECGKSLGESLELIISRRPGACPNQSFLAALVRLELKLNNGNPSDLRQFPSLPKHWAFVEWPCPHSQSARFVSCHGRVMKITKVTDRPKLFKVSNFLTAAEREEIVQTASPNLHPSLVVRHDVVGKLAGMFVSTKEKEKEKTGEVSKERTSWNCRVSCNNRTVRAAVQRACFLSKVPPSHAEPAQVVRYLPGQRYSKHHDYFNREASGFFEKTKLGGQRLTTTLCYLKQPEFGGRTFFPKINKGFDPKPGDALLWWNVTETGKEDPMTLHTGEPVVAGEKWALNLWLRERPNREKNEPETQTS